MKGIILAGGSGTRLAPLTNIISKQLLPVYDKPMICYPLATLMNFNIREILIISTPNDIPRIKDYLKDGAQFGLKISYAVQDEPKGIAESFIIGEKFIGKDDVCLVLGDNIFYGSEVSGDRYELRKRFRKFKNGEIGAFIFTYHVSDPERYGVANLDEKGEKIIDIEEKPKNPKSNLAITGLYIYNNDVIKIAKNLKPSARGELEITDVNKVYLEKGKLDFIKLRRGFAWLDAGTPDSLLDSAAYIQTIEKRQGLKIACIEEIAFRKKFINKEQLETIIKQYKKGCDYRKYLENIKNHD
jgi:glucose-1-phosphate thymidylyltransferase